MMRTLLLNLLYFCVLSSLKLMEYYNKFYTTFLYLVSSSVVNINLPTSDN